MRTISYPPDTGLRPPIELHDSPLGKSAIESCRGLTNIFLYFTIFLSCILSNRPNTSPLLYGVIEILGYIFVTVGILGRLWCGIYLFGRKSKKLCQDGPYSVCRNPLYLFSFITGVGVGAQSNNISVTIAVALIFCGYYFFVVKAEERRLETLFGDEYKTYCKAVPRIIPRFCNYHTPKTIKVPMQAFFPALAKSVWPVLAVAAIGLINLLKAISS